MKLLVPTLALAVIAAFVLLGASHTPPAPRPIRVAVIGGMAETGFWPALAARYEQETGRQVEIVATGPKGPIAAAFRKGKADLISMHSSDTVINLVADGLALDPQPWLRNDLIIVGPPDDPAGIKGMTDAAMALKKLSKSDARFVVHASLGAQEVLHDVLETADVSLAPERTTILMADKGREVLAIAAKEHAYTLVGRIPFLSHKLPGAGQVIMVQGDPRLRRPYLVCTANPRKFPDANAEGAVDLARYLRLPSTQAWVAQFGKGQLDDRPLFFPVDIDR